MHNGGKVRSVPFRHRGAIHVNNNALGNAIMPKKIITIAVCVLILFLSGTILAGHNPSPLADPIPGSIPIGPHTVKLTELAYDNTSFYTNVSVAPDGSDRIFINHIGGIVQVLKNDALLPTPFLDISSTLHLTNSTGLFATAFHPDFAVPGSSGEGKFYSVSQEAPGTGVANFSDTATVFTQSVLYEWQVDSSNPDQVDPSTKRELLRIDEAGGHLLDDLAFGNNDYLYLSKGDSAQSFETNLDGTTIHGSILRIDVNDTSGNGRYSIPSDNPFVGNSDGKIEEIFAYGFRNPWRISIDQVTGKLYVGDVGQDDIEEINIVQSGGNYGWNDKEGSFFFLDGGGVTDDLSDLLSGYDGIDPIAEYDHTEGDVSITGGLVYRGSALPGLYGYYIFGDWRSGRLMSMDPVTHLIEEISIDLGGPSIAEGIIGFSETEAGELLITAVDRRFGIESRVFSVGAATVPVPVPAAMWLFGSGLIGLLGIARRKKA